MSAPIRVHPEAEAEFADAVAWYARQRPDLAGDFAEALNEAIVALRREPNRFPVTRGRTRRDLETISSLPS